MSVGCGFCDAYAQSVELQAANKALEEKTSELQTSERILKEQQEELKSANQELEEKTIYLQQQKLAVQEQNSKIEAASYALEERAKELELASKYKSEFLANMSHELRTPLNSLLILSKSLSKNADGNLTVRQVENATMIYNSGNDLLSLINEILDLSKVEAGKMVTEITETKLSDMLEILQRQFRPIATEQALSFNITVDPKLPALFHTGVLSQYNVSGHAAS